MISKGLLILIVVGFAYAQDYAAEDQTANEQHLAPNYAHHHDYDPHLYETARAEPYDFGFQSTDEFGTIINRQESSDNTGAVKGSYGYTDPHGVFRHVDYVADEYGFRAEVKSNEPGLGTQSPANVQIYAEPPPAGVIVERPHYHPHHHQPNPTPQQHQPPRRNPGGNPNRSRPAAGAQNPATRPAVSRSAPYPFVPPQPNAFASNALGSSQYPSTVSGQYGGNSGAGAYQSRPTYLSGASGTQTRNLAGPQASASAQPAPIVPRPYEGPTYRVGNPHVTDLVRAEKEEGAGYHLGAASSPALVKHVHNYPAAPTA